MLSNLSYASEAVQWEPPVFQSLGSFSIDDSDGSENVTFKMNWRFFKLFRVYSNSLKMSKVGKFLIQVKKEKENFVVACLRPP